MKITINSFDNKNIKFLYNKALDAMNRSKSGGIITNDKIVIENALPQEIKKLKQEGILYIKGKKK